MAKKGVIFKTYLKYVKEIFSDNKEIISQQYVGVSVSFYNESINKWIDLFNSKRFYSTYKYGFLSTNFINPTLFTRKNSEYYEMYKNLLDPKDIVLNDMQFLCLMIGKECYWYDDQIEKLIEKYK